MADSIKDLIIGVAETAQSAVKTNTVLGDAITIDGTTVIPVYKVALGFGGGGFNQNTNQNLAGGAGAGVSLQPISYITIKDGNITVKAAETKKSTITLDTIKNTISKIKSKKTK